MVKSRKGMGLQCETTCGPGTHMDDRSRKCVPEHLTCSRGTRMDETARQCVPVPNLPKCVYNGNHKFDVQCTIDGQTFTVLQNVDMIDRSKRMKSQKHCDNTVAKGDNPGGFGTCGQLLRNIVDVTNVDDTACQVFHNKSWPSSVAFDMPVKTEKATQVVETAQACAKLCMKTSDCRAFSYDPTHTTCKMHTQMAYYPPLKDGHETVGSCPKF